MPSARHPAPRRNQPNVHESKLLDNPDGWHGAELSVVIAGALPYGCRGGGCVEEALVRLSLLPLLCRLAGSWTYYRAKVIKYLQQIAVITPYAQVV